MNSLKHKLLLLPVALLASLLSVPACACWIPHFPSHELLTYRVVENYGQNYYHWTASRAPFCDAIIDSLARHASHTQDERRLMAFAQEVAHERETLIDPWHYCYQGDPLVARLDSLSQVAQSRLGDSQGDRYMVQALRTLMSLHRYQEIIALWNRYHWRNPRLSLLGEGYLAGAYYHCGDYAKALALYRHCGDKDGILLCLQKLGCADPATQLLDGLMQESDAYSYEYMAERLHMLVKNGELDSVRGICRAHLPSCHRQYRALLHYTEAYVLYEQKKYQSALRAVEQARRYAATPLLDGSIRVLRVLIEAETRPYDEAYRTWLVQTTRWMIGRVQRDRLVCCSWCYSEEQDASTCLRENAGDILWHRQGHISTLYHADMLNRMVDNSVVPKMLAAGDTIRAIQMLDVSEYCGIPDSLKRELNSHACASFCFAYECSCETLRQLLYANTDDFARLWEEHGSGAHTDKWIDLVGTRMLLDGRYVAAVRYLERVSQGYRNQELHRATGGRIVDDEEKQPARMRDPFALAYMSGFMANDSTAYTEAHADYKLRFARRMVQLQWQMHHGTPSQQAEATLLFATGMHNSVSPCWWLTVYGQGEGVFAHYLIQTAQSHRPPRSDSEHANRLLQKDYYWWDSDNEWGEALIHGQLRQNRLLARSRAYLRQAVRRIPQVNNHERLASMLWQMGYYRTVKHRLGETALAQEKRGACDNWNFW